MTVKKTGESNIPAVKKSNENPEVKEEASKAKLNQELQDAIITRHKNGQIKSERIYIPGPKGNNIFASEKTYFENGRLESTTIAYDENGDGFNETYSNIDFNSNGEITNQLSYEDPKSKGNPAKLFSYHKAADGTVETENYTDKDQDGNKEVRFKKTEYPDGTVEIENYTDENSNGRKEEVNKKTEYPDGRSVIWHQTDLNEDGTEEIDYRKIKERDGTIRTIYFEDKNMNGAQESGHWTFEDPDGTTSTDTMLDVDDDGHFDKSTDRAVHPDGTVEIENHEIDHGLVKAVSYKKYGPDGELIDKDSYRNYFRK